MKNFSLVINGETYSSHQYVDAVVASSLLGLSRRTIQDLAARRVLPVAKFGRANRFLLKDLWEWAQKRRVAGKGAL